MAMDVAVPGAPGLLLAGDAAGFIDPMTGDGIRLALAGAEIAADVADAVLRGELGRRRRAPAVLARRRRAAFAGKWRFNRAVRGLVGSRRAARRGARRAGAGRALFEAMVCYAGDVGRRRAPAGGAVPVAVSIAARHGARRARRDGGRGGAVGLQRRACCDARGAVEPADDVYRRCSGPIRCGFVADGRSRAR